MLVKAKYNGTKIEAFHVEKVDEIIHYCNDLKKDASNGFTKERSMRRIASVPYLTLLEYDREHPGFLHGIMNPRDAKDKQKLWHEFLNSEYGKPFMMVPALKTRTA